MTRTSPRSVSGLLAIALLAGSLLPQQASAEVPEVLQERQAQLFAALDKVRGTVVGVSDGMGVGSGVVVSGDGIVLTASHVVQTGRGRGRRSNIPERVVTITFPDGKEYPAKILGKNSDADAAVLKMTQMPDDGAPFPHAKMGRTTETSVGDWCFALGHPGGYRPERSAPVRLGRILSVGNFTVVSDAPILLGDSGGPLFNMQGEVIGIHSMITSLIIENRHVAIDSFHDDWDRLLAGERWGRLRASDDDLIESGFFGVQLKWTDFIPEIRKVTPSSPAARAGLKRGDVLVAINKNPIADRLDLETTLDLLDEGQTIDVDIRRAGTAQTIALTTGDDTSPESDEQSDPRDDMASESDQEREREIMDQLSESRRVGKFEKRTAEVLKPYASVVAPHKNSVVTIRDGGLLLCLGTVVSSDGYILTKASELDGAIDPEVLLPSGRRFKAVELGSDHAFDLMLLKVDAVDLEPARFRSDQAPAGELALVQDVKGNPLMPTVVSVVAHSMASANTAFLGVQPARDANGVRIARVIPGGSASRSGLKEDDIILSVDGRDIHAPEELIDRILEFSPGDSVAVRYMRGDTIKTLELKLSQRFTNENPLLPLYNNPEVMGQFASTHSGGFPRVLQIDADVYPTKVGGPLLDLHGNAIGIVIARADRYPTYAIPADSVLAVFDQLRKAAHTPKAP